MWQRCRVVTLSQVRQCFLISKLPNKPEKSFYLKNNQLVLAGAVCRSLTDGVRDEDSPRGTPHHHPAGHIPAHLQTHQDMHERGPRETTFLRNDLAHTRENETLNKERLR